MILLKSSLPLQILRFIATIDADGVDGVELPQSKLSGSPEDDDVIDDIIIEDKEEFILMLVLIIDPPVLIIDLDILDPPIPTLLSSSTLLGRTNFPRFGPQLK